MRKYFFSVLLAAFVFNSKAQNTAGDSVFNLPTIHTIYLNFWQTNFWDSLKNNYSLDKKMLCNAIIDGQVIDSIGVQLKGNSSYNSYPGNKKPFKLDFNYKISSNDWDGLNGVILNNAFKDPTMMREKIMLDHMNKFGVPAPRCTYAKLYLNNQYWGFYSLVEEATSSKFLKDRFGDNNGNLFKGDPQGSLQWLGASPSLYYTKYELKTNETLNNWSDLVHLIDEINNTPTAQFYDSLNKVMNVNSYLYARAGNIIYANLDSYDGSGHNYYIYHDSITNKFNWIVWDVNEAFGNFNMGMSLAQLKALNIFFIPNPGNNRPLASKTMADNQFKAMYIQALCNLTINYFKNSVMDPYIDSLANRIRADYYADPNKAYTNQQFEDNIKQDIVMSGMPGGSNIAGLKPWITSRRQDLETQLAPYGCYLTVSEEELSLEAVVFPNPVNEQLNISFTEKQTNCNLKLLNALGEVVLLKNEKQTNFISLSVNGLSPGIYLLNVNDKVYRKIIIER